jgi:hypothetical protein
VLDAFGSGVKTLQNKAAFITAQPSPRATSPSSEREKETEGGEGTSKPQAVKMDSELLSRTYEVPYQRVDLKIEQHLTKSPIKFQGVGLPRRFHQLFDEMSDAQKASIKKERNFTNKYNMQIRFDVKFQNEVKTRKKREDALYKDIKRHIRPIKKFVEENVVEKNKINEVEGI